MRRSVERTFVIPGYVERISTAFRCLFTQSGVEREDGRGSECRKREGRTIQRESNVDEPQHARHADDDFISGPDRDTVDVVPVTMSKSLECVRRGT